MAGESAPKRPSDPSQLAKLVADIATGSASETASEFTPMAKLGRVGGLKGGRAHADSLTAAVRTEIAQEAAAARWGRDRGNRDT